MHTLHTRTDHAAKQSMQAQSGDGIMENTLCGP